MEKVKAYAVPQTNGKGFRGYIRYKDHAGKRRQKGAGTYKLKRQALSAAQQLAAEYERKLNSDFSGMSFLDYYDYWFATFKERQVHSNSGQAHYAYDRKVFAEYFADAPLADLTPQRLQDFLNDFGKHKSYETARKVKGVLCAVIRSAAYDGAIDRDITFRLRLTFNRDNSHPKEYLSVEELKRLIDQTREGLNPLFTSRYMILTAAYTGARKAEIQALKWSNINFKAKTISIQDSWDEKTKTLKPTKTKSSVRTIAVSQSLLDDLKSLQDNDIHSEFVFTNCFGCIPTSTALLKTLRGLLKQCKIDKPSFRFHDLRHVHVGYLMKEGEPMAYISKRLGHSSTRVTQSVYAYLIKESKTAGDRLAVSATDKL